MTLDRIDPRILIVGIEVSGQLRVYQDLDITVNIAKTSNQIQNESTVTIANLAKDVRDHLLTETSPYNKNYTPKQITVQAGRNSIGAHTIFSGSIIETSPTQPPDIITTITAKTLNFNKGVVIAASYSKTTAISTIAADVAKRLGLALTFEATDRNIANFSFTGASSKLIDKLNEFGGVSAFADDNRLVVVDAGKPLKAPSHIVSEDTGMVGLPELTAIGVRVKFMLSPGAQIHGGLTIDSKQNPALNGDYVIYNLWYVAASRDVAFYTIAECLRPGRIDTMTGFPLLLTP